MVKTRKTKIHTVRSVACPIKREMGRNAALYTGTIELLWMWDSFCQRNRKIAFSFVAFGSAGTVIHARRFLLIGLNSAHIHTDSWATQSENYYDKSNLPKHQRWCWVQLRRRRATWCSRPKRKFDFSRPQLKILCSSKTRKLCLFAHCSSRSTALASPVTSNSQFCVRLHETAWCVRERLFCISSFIIYYFCF